MVGAGAALWQSANWRTLFGGFSPLARGLNYITAPMEKELFLGFFARRCLQGNWSSCSEECNEGDFKAWHCSQVTEWALQCAGWGMVGTVKNYCVTQAIINAPSLVIPDYSKHFLLYTFASETSYAVVLTQLNEEYIEAPISFLS